MYKLFLFFLFFNYLNSISVGFLKRKDNNDDINYIKIMKDYSTEILQNSGENIDIIEEIYEGDNDSLISCLNNLVVSKYITLIYAYCDSIITSVDWSLFKEYGILIWCINTYSYAACMPTHIMGNSLNNVIETIPFIMSRSYDGFVYIGGHSYKEVDDYYLKYLRKANKLMGIEEIGFIQEDISGEIGDVVDEIKDFIDNNGNVVTYIFNNDITVINSVLSAYNTKSIDLENNRIIVLNSGIKDSDVLQLSNYVLYQNYYEPPASDPNEYDQYYTQFTNGLTINDKSQTAFIFGITSMLCYAITNSNSTLPYALLTTIYSREFEYPGGKMTLLASHYITTESHLYEVNSNTLTLKYNIPARTQFEPEQTLGEILEQTCNFTITHATGRDDKNTINVLMVESVEGELKFDKTILKRLLIEYIDEINKEGGIIGQSVQISFINIEKNIDDVIENILNVTATHDIHTIFLFTTPEIRIQITNEITDDEYDILFFYFGAAEGEECKRNIIYANPVGTNYVKSLVTYLPLTSKYYILSSKLRFAKTITSYLISQLTENGLSSEQLPFTDLLEPKDEDIKKMIDDDVKGFIPNGGYIIITAEEVYQSGIFKALKELGLTIDNGYTAISMNLNSITTKIIGYNIFHGNMYMVHVNEGSQGNDGFLKEFNLEIEHIMKDYYPISGTMGLFLNVLQQWNEAIELSGYSIPSVYKEYIYHKTTPTPSAGPYEIYYNGYGQGQMRIVKVTDAGVFSIEYEDTFSRTPYAFSNDSFICDWTKADPIRPLDSYIIGSLFNTKSSNGVKRFNELTLILELVNQEGGVNGRNLKIITLNYDEDPDNIILCAEKVINDPNFLCYFGTDSEEEREILQPFLEEHDKLCFVFLDAHGEVAYKNIIQMSFITHQYETYQIYWAYNYYDAIIVVHDNDSVTLERVKYIENLAGTLGQPYLESILFNDTRTQTDYIKSRIDTDYPKLCIVTILASLTGDFLLQYTASGIDKAKNPVLITDFTLRLMNNYDNNLFAGHFGGEAFYRRSQKEINKALFEFIETYKGEPDDNVNQNMIVNYDIVQLLVEGLKEAQTTSGKDLKNELYYIRLNLPNGLMGITKNNYATAHNLIVIVDDQKDAKEYMDLPFPIMPYPFYYSNNDNEYYKIDYSISGSGEKELDNDFYGIAYFFELNDKEEEGFLNFIIANIYIETTNYNLGINNKNVYAEVYQCPKSEGDSASILLSLYKRNFKVIIGGCNSTVLDYMLDPISALQILFFYTGQNSNQVCSDNIVNLAVHSTQYVLPAVLHFIYTENRPVTLVYSNSPEYETQVLLIKDIFKEFSINFVLSSPVNTTLNKEDLKTQIQIILYEINLKSPSEGAILVLLNGESSELFLEISYDYFSKFLEPDTIADYYTIYLIDNSHSSFDKKYHDNFVYTPYVVDESNPENKEFDDNIKSLTNGNHAKYSNALIADATRLALNVFEKAYNTDFSQFKEVLYDIEIKTELGTIRIDEGNFVNQNIYFGRINDSGMIVPEKTVTEGFHGEVYRDTLNREEYYVCDLKSHQGKYKRETINIGVILPSDYTYLTEGIHLYQGLYTAIENENLQNNGIKNKYIQMIVTSDNNDPVYTAKKMEELIEKYNIFIFIGGWSKDIRKSLHQVSLLRNCVIFYPADYEGEECDYNGYYLGTPYTSFSILPSLIINKDDENTIILYSDKDYSQYFAENLKEDLEYYGINLLLYLQISVDNDDMEEVINLIKQISPQTATIINLLDGDPKTELLILLDEAELKPPNFITININYNDIIIHNLGKIMNNHYVVDTNNENDINDLRTKYSELYNHYFSFTGTLNYISYNGIAASQIIINIMNTIDEINYNNFRSEIYELTTDTVYGKLKINKDNSINMKILLKRVIVDDNNVITLENEYISIYDSVNHPFGSVIRENEIKECDLRYSNDIEDIPTKKIAFFLSLSGTEKESSMSVLYGAISSMYSLFDKELINGHKLIMKLINYESDYNKIEELIKEVEIDDDIVAYMGCSTMSCKKKVQDAAKRNNKLFYYPRMTVGQECDYNTIYTGIVANQYVTRILEYLISTSFNKYIYLIVEGEDDEINLQNIIIDASQGLFTIQGSYVITDSTPLSISVIEGITGNELKDGGIIMTIFQTPGYINKFLEYLYKLHIDYNKYGIVDTILENEELSDVPTEQLEGLYKFSKYFEEISTENNINFGTNVYHYTGQKTLSSLLTATYESVMLFVSAVQKGNSFDTDIVRKNSYGTSVISGSGTVTIYENNYVTAPFFVIKYDSQGKYSLTYSKFDVQTPSPWSWNLGDTYSMMCSFVNGENSQYKVPVKRTVLVASLTGDDSDSSQGLVDVYQMAINEINDAGGIGGYTIKADVFDVQSNNDYCILEIPTYIKKYEPIVVFSVVSEECYNGVSSYLQANPVLYFELNKKKQGFCEKYVMVAVEHSSFYEPIIDVIINRFYDNILIVTSTGKESEHSTSEYVKDYFTSFNISFNDYTTNEIDTSTLLTKLEEYNKSVSKSGVIIYFGGINSFKILMTTLSNNNYNEEIHHVIAMENGHLFRSLGYNYEIAGFYEQDDNSDINIAFKEKIYQRIDSDLYISDLMIRTYSSMKLWSDATNILPLHDENGYQVADLSIDNVKNAITTVKEELPEGLVMFTGNHYLSRIPRLSIIYSDKTSELKYSAVYARSPDAYAKVNGQYYICDYTNSEILDGEPVSTYTVAILLSLTGKDREKETPLLQSIITAIEKANLDGLIINNYIHYDLFDAQSDPEVYYNKAKELSTSKYTIIFGGYNSKTLENIGNLFDNSDKFFFFLGQPLGNKCYSNVIIPELHPIQIVDATIRRLLELSTSSFIIHTSDDFAVRITNLLSDKMQNLIITSNGNIDIESRTNVRIVNDITRALPNGGYITTIINDKNELIRFYNAICSNGITYPTYTIINIFLDENVAKEIDNSCLNGFITIGSYFESLSDESKNSLTIPTTAADFNTYFHVRIGDIYATSEYEAVYSAFELWKNIVKKANSFEFSEISEIYHYYIDVPSDQLEVNVNNYFNRRVYAGTFDSSGNIIINWGPTSTFKPSIYDQYNNDEIGYTCDWSDPNKGEKYYTNPIIISFIHEKDIGGKTERYNAIIEDIVISDINSAGGVLGRELASNHTWLTINDAYRRIRAIDEVGRSNLIFGCITSECRTEVVRYLQAKDYLFFFTGRDDGYQCSETTITIGLTFNQKILILMDYISTFDIQYIFIIGPERNSYIYIYY